MDIYCSAYVTLPILQDMHFNNPKMDELKNGKILELQTSLNNLKKGFGVRERSLEKQISEQQQALELIQLSQERTRHTLR